LLEMFLDQEALSQVQSQLKPNTQIIEISEPYLREEIDKVIGIILQPAPIIPSDTVPSFSTQFKQWASRMMGGYVYLLEPCFEDGIVSVEALVKRALTTKLTASGGNGGLGGLEMMLPMVSNVIGSVVMSCYQTYRQEKAAEGGSDGWIQHVPQKERKLWQDTIQTDEKSQKMILNRNTAFVRNQSVMFSGQPGLEQELPITLQKPLSSVYRGLPLVTSNNKRKTPDSKETDEEEEKERRKLLQLSASMSESGLEKGLKQAIEETERNEKKDEKDKKESDKAASALLEGIKDTNLNSLYRRQVLRDMNKRLRIDSDYNATRFPNSTKELFKEK